VSQVILAMSPVPGQTQFMSGICATSPRANQPHCPSVPAASGPQQETKVAAGMPSLHILPTPILMKPSGFWLRLAESVFCTVVKLEARLEGMRSSSLGDLFPACPLGNPSQLEPLTRLTP